MRVKPLAREPRTAPIHVSCHPYWPPAWNLHSACVSVAERDNRLRLMVGGLYNSASERRNAPPQPVIGVLMKRPAAQQSPGTYSDEKNRPNIPVTWCHHLHTRRRVEERVVGACACRTQDPQGS